MTIGLWRSMSVRARSLLVGGIALVIASHIDGPTASGQSSPEAAPNSRAWTSLGLGGGGAMFTPAISPADPNRILLNCDMGGAYLTRDGGQNWELLHYRQLGSSTSVAPVWHPRDPAVAFAAGGWRGPLRVTRDGGRTWSEVPGVRARVTTIAIDPGNPGVMLVGGSDRMLRSTDGGETWQRVGDWQGSPIGFHIDQTSPAGKRTCFAATTKAMFRSGDGGVSWREVSAAPRSILGFTGGSNATTGNCLLYLSVAGKQGEPEQGSIFRSDDRGESWQAVRGKGLESSARGVSQFEFLATTDVDPSRLYAARSREGQVYRSDDRGATWRPLLFPTLRSKDFNVGPNYLIDERGGGRDNISGFAINPANPNQVLVSDWMSCYLTRDGGETWASLHTRSAEEPGRRGPGMRWVNNGLVVTSVWHYDIDPFEPNRHYIAYTDIGFARSTDAGKTWYWQSGRPLRNTTYELAFDPETPGLIWGAFSDLHDIPNANVISGRHYFPRAGGGVGISTDFGATWKDSSQGLPGKPVVSVIVDPRSPKGSRALYASVFEEGVFKSTDAGQSWSKVSQGLGKPEGSLRACRLILHRDGSLFCLVTALKRNGQYVADGPGLYRSTDGGSSWSWINRATPLLWPKDFDVDPRDSRVIYLGAADAGRPEGGLYKTTDGGSSWTRVARKGDDCFGATVDPRNPDRVYLCIAEAGSESGLWRSDDAGKSWSAVEGLPFPHVQRVSFDRSDPSVVYVSTFGGSVWRGPAD